MMTPKLIHCMVEAAKASNPLAFRSASLRKEVEVTEAMAYRYFAHYIHLQALQEKPSDVEREGNNILRSRFTVSQTHFHHLFPETPPLGQTLFMVLHSKLLLGPDSEATLTKNFSKLVLKAGQWVTGDEKLYGFEGQSAHKRKKHEDWGIWFYELCGKLASNHSFLISVRSHSVDSGLGQKIPTAEVMDGWATLIKGFDRLSKTILVADSYYLDQLGYSETRETFAHHYYTDAIGKKYVLSNCLIRGSGTSCQMDPWL